MANKTIDEKVYNDLLQQASMCDEAKRTVEVLIDTKTRVVELYRELNMNKQAYELTLKIEGIKTALNCMEEVAGEFYNYKGLYHRVELFRDAIKHELRIKRDAIDAYSQIEHNEDYVNLMKHEYSGMILVREIFEKFMRE